MCYNNIRGNAKGEPQAKGRYKMNGAKMLKNFFFQMIEERLEELTEEVKAMKAEKEASRELQIAKENIIFGRLLELNKINFYARDVDFLKYLELDEKISAVKDMI